MYHSEEVAYKQKALTKCYAEEKDYSQMVEFQGQLEEILWRENIQGTSAKRMTEIV